MKKKVFRPEPTFLIGRNYSNRLQCIQYVSERNRNGRIWFEAKLPSPFGDGNRIAGSGKTPLEAFDDAANKYVELRDNVTRLSLDGEALTSRRYTLQQISALFLESKKDIVVPETDRNRRLHIKKCGKLLERDVTTIRRSEWLAFFNGLKRPERGKPLSDSYVDNIYHTIQLILYFAKDRGILQTVSLDADLYRRIKWNKSDSREREALTVEETRIYLAYAKLHFLYAYHLARILLISGMRCGELMALEWTDLDFEGEIIRIHYTLEGKNLAILQLRPPKTKAGIRIIPMLPLVKESFQFFAEYQRNYNCANTLEVAIFEGKSFKERRVPDLVFTTLKCNPLMTGVARKRIQDVLKSYNREAEKAQRQQETEAAKTFRWFTTHELRNTCITRLWEQGIELTIVKAYVGHKIRDITFGRYTTRMAEFLRIHLKDFDVEKEVDEKEILKRRNDFWQLGEETELFS